MVRRSCWAGMHWRCACSGAGGSAAAARPVPGVMCLFSEEPETGVLMCHAGRCNRAQEMRPKTREAVGLCQSFAEHVRGLPLLWSLWLNGCLQLCSRCGQHCINDDSKVQALQPALCKPREAQHLSPRPCLRSESCIGGSTSLTGCFCSSHQLAGIWRASISMQSSTAHGCPFL